MTLVEYVSTENAKTRAWIAEDPENRWATTWVEELDFWTKCGITTVEQFRLSNAVQAYSDTYKEMHGIRPRWKDFTGATADQVEDEIEKLYAEEKALQDRKDAEKARIDAVYEATRTDPKPLTHNPFAGLKL